MRVKIYGYGWVGRAQAKLFPGSIIVDPKLSHYHSSVEKEADIAFVCVPTPLKDGDLDTSIVQEVIAHAPEMRIVIRSTVPPGFCGSYGWKSIVYQPEYLGETTGHPFSDMAARGFMVLGGEPEDRRKVIELYQQVLPSIVHIRQVSLLEAEIIKLSENRAIAFKVAQCQELYDACEKQGVDYYTIRDAVYHDDPRFNLWHTFVYPDKRGFNSKCLPKDVYAWAAWAESLGMNPVLTKSMLAYNETLIRDQVRA